MIIRQASNRDRASSGSLILDTGVGAGVEVTDGVDVEPEAGEELELAVGVEVVTA
ncbi:MAG: hypothetical protein IIB11_05750 [Chloroflexi bacterium]|nr:hypothetical protein [Chloroflexota bacterium]